MEKELTVNKKSTLSSYLRTIVILLLCIYANYFGREVAKTFSLPGWFDSYGTFFAAYTMGPIPGAIVGASANIIFSFWAKGAALYMVVSIFIGLSVGYFSRKRYFDTFFYTMTLSGAVTTGCAVMSAIINFIFYGGDTGNMWGNGAMDMLMENGLNKYPAGLIGEFYIEFPDKLFTSIAMYLLIKLVRAHRKRKLKKAEAAAKSAAAITAAIAVFVTANFGFAGNSVSAQGQGMSTAYIQTVYDGSNGLSSGHANAIAQTNEGVLWIGTYAGLYRYNGSEFVLRSDIEEVRNVNCLYVDSEGRLWIGTNDNGVVIVINEKVANVINSKNGLPSDSIRSIIQSSTGEYYIGTSEGIVTMEMKIGMSVSDKLEDIGYVDRMSADQSGRIAAVSNTGELFILKGGKVTNKITAAYGGRKISACAFDDEGSVYIGTTDGMVSKYLTRGEELKLWQNTFCDATTKINNIYPMREGDMTWVCADSGIGYIDQRSVFIRQETGEFDHSVESMITDYQGNLWFASSRLGLLRLSRSSFKDIYADTGLGKTVVNSTAIRNGLLYAGTDDGLDIINIDAQTTMKNDLTEMLKGSRIRCMMTDSDQKLWVCSYGAGLVCSDRFNKITNYSERFKEIGERVRVCLELQDGTMAISSSNGLFFLKNDRITGKIPYDEKTGHTPTLCFLQTPDGTLYAGTDGSGILVIKDGNVERVLDKKDGLTSGVILRMVFDPDDASIYIVTSNSICAMAEGSIKQLKAFPYSNNYDIMLDGNGDILVPGSAGIYVVNKKQLLEQDSPEYVVLNSKTGLVGALTANAWNTVDSERNVYLSSGRGVFMMNLDDYVLKQKYFRLMVSEVKLDDKQMSIERGTEFKVERDTVKIDFVPEIINYSLDDPTVSYKLEGFDSDWTNVKQSELSTIPYTNIKPGNYTFRIAIRDDSGKIIEESSYEFEKKKAIYDNTWFRLYIIIVGGIFVGWLTWFISRRTMQRTLELQQTKLEMALKQVQMGNETILAIANTVDAKDLRTSRHSYRVSEYSALIAKEYGFTDDECENLRKAALLHDIGKIAIPDRVLNKPGRLDDEEYAIMKSHVIKGAEILKDFTLIDHVVEGARYHHERYDGRGYPDGLKGDEIPLYGRIIAVADAFDAMTANRVYRKQQDFDYVLDELKKNRGTQFDPELLDIFLKLIDDKKIDLDAIARGDHQKGEEEENEQRKT